MRTHKRWLTVGAVLLALLLVSAIPVGADPGIIYVDGALGTNIVGCGVSSGTYACATIQYAITTHAAAGDTIMVASGTAAIPIVYNENVAINIPNLTMLSSGGRASTVIDGPGAAPTVHAQALSTGLTFGQPGRGFTLRDSAANSTALFNLTGGPDNITVASNIFDRSVAGAWNSAGVLVGTMQGLPILPVVTADGLCVIDNRFDQGAGAFVGVDVWEPVSNLLVDGNDFIGVAPSLWLSAVSFEGTTVDGAVISNNTMRSTSIMLGLGDDTTYIDHVTISGNTFDDTIHDEGGIIMLEFSGNPAVPEPVLQRASNIDITGNTFNASGYDSYAFLIDGIAGTQDQIEETDIDYTTLHFNQNNVLDPAAGNTHPQVGNLPVDLGVSGVPTLDAECNWWGTRDGPLGTAYTDPVDPPGYVDVSNDVDFAPWLDAPSPGSSCWVGGILNMTLAASPSQVAADAVNFSTVSATLTDPSANPVRDGTMVDFFTDLGFFTRDKQDVEWTVPTVGGVANVKLYSDRAGYATINAQFVSFFAEADRFVTFVPRRPRISYPPHRSTIRRRRPTLSWTASPSAVPTLVYQMKLKRLRPRPKEMLFDIVTDQTSFRTPYLDGRVYVVRVRACLDDSLTLCSRWKRSRFKIR